MLENKSCIGTSFSTLKGIDFCALCVSEHALLYDMDRFVRVYFSREADYDLGQGTQPFHFQE